MHVATLEPPPTEGVELQALLLVGPYVAMPLLLCSHCGGYTGPWPPDFRVIR